MAYLWKSTRLCLCNSTRLCGFRRRVASLQNPDPNSHLRVIWFKEVWAATVCQPLVDVVSRLPRNLSDRWLIGQCSEDGSPDWFTHCPLPAHPPFDPPFLVGLLSCCTKHGSPDRFIYCHAGSKRLAARTKPKQICIEWSKSPCCIKHVKSSQASGQCMSGGDRPPVAWWRRTQWEHFKLKVGCDLVFPINLKRGRRSYPPPQPKRAVVNKKVDRVVAHSMFQKLALFSATTTLCIVGRDAISKGSKILKS